MMSCRTFLTITAIIALSLSTAFAQDFWVGTWRAEVLDDDCDYKCCCPTETLTIVRDPGNSSALLVTGKFSGSQVCSELGLSEGQKTAVWPFEAGINSTTNKYNPFGEQFDVEVHTKSTRTGEHDLYAELTIDDTRIQNVEDPTFCYVTLVKTGDIKGQSIVHISVSILIAVMSMMYL